VEWGYDFWYQPRFDVVISSEFGSPNAFKQGFDPSLVGDKYGSRLHVWSWTTKEHQQVIDLGPDGLIPLEIRFLHEPSQPQGFLGAALSSNVHRIHKAADGKGWTTTVGIRQPWTKVSGWALPEQPPLITDILVSLDDKYLYFSNWIRGDINQYDISDPENPKHVGRVWVGGSIRKGSGVTVLEGEFKDNQPDIPEVKGTVLQGGPQMIQLSLDGKRLYVTNSLFSPWDKQFYPEMVEKGSQLLRINVDTEKGGLSIDEDFLIDFGKEPDGPVLAHEVRFPGGDSSSDIWV
jgi:selenium-binding protein 1